MKASSSSSSPGEGTPLSVTGCETLTSCPSPKGRGGQTSERLCVIAWSSPERSDVMMLGGNYVELTVEGGSFGSVDAGDFHRWELLEKKDGELVRAFRGAKILRLHAPLLEASETLKSGTIRVSGGKVTATGSFVVPGGTVVAAELVGAVP